MKNIAMARDEAQRFVDCFCECGHPDMEHVTFVTKGRRRTECRPGTTADPTECNCRRFRRAPLKVVIVRGKRP